jgi:hypothetical protein
VLELHSKMSFILGWLVGEKREGEGRGGSHYCEFEH